MLGLKNYLSRVKVFEYPDRRIVAVGFIRLVVRFWDVDNWQSNVVPFFEYFLEVITTRCDNHAMQSKMINLT